MAKKFQKTIQRVDTAKISEVYKSDKSATLDDLKIKLAGTSKTDELSELKNKLVNKIDDNDPFAELKRALLNSNQSNEIKEDAIEEILEEYNEGIAEEVIIDEIIAVEVAEEEAEEAVHETIQQQEVEYIDPVKYYYEYKDSYNNNILVREVEKRKDEKLVVHIALNNLEYDSYNRKTLTPFEIYHKGVKILDFYQFKKDSTVSYNFKKDIYILRNNLVIDSKTYLLEEIEIVNINLQN